MNPTNAIVQLNKYDREKYNVLVPVTTMQVASNLQRITVSEVQLDVRQNSSNNGPSKDIYPDEGPGQYDPAEDPDEPEGGEWGDEGAASGAWGEPQSAEDDICADCHRKIVSPPGKNWKVSDIVAYSKRIYGRALCQVCQDKARSAQRGGR